MMNIKLEKIWNNLRNELTTEQSKWLIETAYNKALDFDHHALICQYNDRLLSKKDLYLAFQIIKLLGKWRNDIIVDFEIRKAHNKVKDMVLMVFGLSKIEFFFIKSLNNPTYSVKFRYVLEMLNNVNLRKERLIPVDYGNNFDFIMGFEILKENLGRLDYVSYHLSPFEIIKDWEKIIKPLYDTFYTSESLEKRKLEQIERTNIIKERYEYIDQREYWNKMYFSFPTPHSSSNFLLLPESALFRTLLIQRFNKLEYFVENYIKYGFVPNYFEKEIIDMIFDADYGDYEVNLKIVTLFDNKFEFYTFDFNFRGDQKYVDYIQKAKKYEDFSELVEKSVLGIERFGLAADDSVRGDAWNKMYKEKWGIIDD